MERVFRIFGQPTTISDFDESQYLADRSADFEEDTLSVFAAFCRPDSNVLDVGANIGLTAIALGRLCSQGKVFAIEASPATFEYLQANVARAGLTNVTCQNMAAASTSGEVEIAFNPSFSAGGFVSQKFQVCSPEYRHATVPARAMDDYLASARQSPIDFIKVDVEGFELEVLRGARRTIQAGRPVLYCEVNHCCLSAFQGIGLPEFIAGVFEFFPHVFAVNSNLRYLDLSDPDQLSRFYRDHTTRLEYMNLLGGFDKSALATKLANLPSIIGVTPAEIAKQYQPGAMGAVAAKCRRRLRAWKRSLRSST